MKEKLTFRSITTVPVILTTRCAYYSRSLRQHDDVVSIGLSYVLRAPKIEAPSEAQLLGEVVRPIAAPSY